LQDEDWIARGDRVGTFFLDELKRLAGIYTIVKEARGRGMLLGLELHPNDHLSVRSLYLALVKRGFVTGYYSVGNVLRLDPALTIDEADIASFIACLEGILADAEVRAV
jgi:acetylornithine aminotransferase